MRRASSPTSGHSMLQVPAATAAAGSARWPPNALPSPANGLGTVSYPLRAMHDPRASSTHSLVSSMDGAAAANKRRLLVIYIHGFMGNNSSFRSFPAHVHSFLKDLLAETHTVHTKIYPRYKTYKSIDVARDNFSAWLAPHESPTTDVVLVGHSMGGLLAADVVLLVRLFVPGRGGGEPLHETCNRLTCKPPAKPKPNRSIVSLPPPDLGHYLARCSSTRSPSGHCSFRHRQSLSANPEPARGRRRPEWRYDTRATALTLARPFRLCRGLPPAGDPLPYSPALSFQFDREHLSARSLL